MNQSPVHIIAGLGICLIAVHKAGITNKKTMKVPMTSKMGMARVIVKGLRYSDIFTRNPFGYSRALC